MSTGRARYRWYVGNLRTGGPLREVDLTNTRWATDIDSGGSLEGSHPLRAGRWPTARADAAPAKSFLAVSYVDEDGGETFLEAGPIWAVNYAGKTGKLAIGAASLMSYFDHRKVIPVLLASQNPATASVTYTAAELGLIAKRLVELAASHANGSLPIVLPSDADLGGAGTDHTRTYPGYELGWIGTRLRQLSDVIGGPEMQFVPRRRADDNRYIEWVMRIGVKSKNMLLTQAGPAWRIDHGLPKAPVRNIDVASDGSAMATRAWAAGEGQAEGRPIAWADTTNLTALGWPLLEAEVTSTDSVSRISTLERHVASRLAAGTSPIETWKIDLARDGKLNAGLIRPGDWFDLNVRSHEYLPDGPQSLRMVGMSGGDDSTVKLAMAPKLGTV